jgi:hypothetical protein
MVTRLTWQNALVAVKEIKESISVFMGQRSHRILNKVWSSRIAKENMKAR